MQTTGFPLSLPTRRHWASRLVAPLIDAWRAWRDQPRPTRLHELDARTLADLGLDASERSSVHTEAEGLAMQTRRRIILRSLNHG